MLAWGIFSHSVMHVREVRRVICGLLNLANFAVRQGADRVVHPMNIQALINGTERSGNLMHLSVKGGMERTAASVHHMNHLQYKP